MSRCHCVLIALLMTALALASCSRPPTNEASPITPLDPPDREQTTLTVMAAASLNAAFSDLAQVFESAHPGVQVQLNVAGSQQLAYQLDQGAPGDIFASANQKQMDIVAASGRVDPASVRVFAQNKLVVIYPRDNPGALAALSDLAKPGLKLVFAAAEVPVGQYTLAFFDRAVDDEAYGLAFKENTLANVVSYEDNVNAVLTKVVLGEADGGIVYASDIAGPASSQVLVLEIPASLNVTAQYPIAPISDTANPALAQAFVDLVLSSQGQDILAGHGFLPAGENSNE